MRQNKNQVESAPVTHQMAKANQKVHAEVPWPQITSGNRIILPQRPRKNCKHDTNSPEIGQAHHRGARANHIPQHHGPDETQHRNVHLNEEAPRILGYQENLYRTHAHQALYFLHGLHGIF